MNHKLEKAIERLRGQSGRYAKARRYYAGLHDLSFATEKFANTFGEMFREFALNLCPAVVDSTRDKLKIKGFSVEDARGGGVDAIRRSAARIWHRNRMALRSGEVHKEALRCGDAYVIVWPGAGGEVQFVPNSADAVAVHYDEDATGRIAWAAKHWRTGGRRTRLNLYFPDRIEKYISKERAEGILPDAKGFVPFPARKDEAAAGGPQQGLLFRVEDDGGSSLRGKLDAPVVENPYGVVPVFHFANNADIGELGRSELEAAMPVQDGLNKSVLDMLVAMEVSAFRQRWVAGIELKIDEETGKEIAPFRSGVDQLWATSDPDTRFGDFGATDLEQFLKVKDGFRIDIASVTGTPLYYLMPHTQAVPSGESLRKAETRFIAKVRDRQAQFGAAWADAMSFALRAAGHPNVSLVTQWEDPAPTSERETLENLRIKKELGLPAEHALAEAGYGGDDAERMSERTPA